MPVWSLRAGNSVPFGVWMGSGIVERVSQWYVDELHTNEMTVEAARGFNPLRVGVDQVLTCLPCGSAERGVGGKGRK